MTGSRAFGVGARSTLLGTLRLMEQRLDPLPVAPQRAGAARVLEGVVVLSHRGEEPEPSAPRFRGTFFRFSVRVGGERGTAPGCRSG